MTKAIININQENIEEVDPFLLTYLSKKETGLPMNIALRDIEDENDKPYLRFQNDKNTKFNSNLVKIYLDGTVCNGKNIKIIFSDDELKELRKWIQSNLVPITRHWNQETDTIGLLKELALDKE